MVIFHSYVSLPEGKVSISLSPWDSSLHLTVNPPIFGWCLCFHRPKNLAAQRECDDGAMVRMPGLHKTYMKTWTMDV